MASPLRDLDPMPFGKFKNKKMKDVPAWYLDWLVDEQWLLDKWPQVKAYIDLNRAVIDKELEDPKRFGNGS